MYIKLSSSLDRTLRLRSGQAGEDARPHMVMAGGGTVFYE